MATQEEQKSESAKKNEDWMNSKWRPAMGWMYMMVCVADFVLFPVLWGLLQTIAGGKVETQWMPITLQGAGLFHMAMGAILGIAAYGRTQEKLNDKAGITAPAPTATPINTPTVPVSPTIPRPTPKPVVPELDPGDPPTRNTRND